MVRRLFYTTLAIILSGSAFDNADPKPDVNLFGVLFLFMAFLVWFYWEDIQAGYSYLDDRSRPREGHTGLMFIRFAPMNLRELVGKKRRPT